MGSPLKDAVILISSKNKHTKSFGTGFAIYRDNDATYVVTCAHVIHDVGGPAWVLVGDLPAEIIAPGSQSDIDGIDLTVLRVQGFPTDFPLLDMYTCAAKGDYFTTAGFKTYTSSETVQFRELDGNLGESTKIGTKQANLVNAWDLHIKSDFPLAPGYSGAPILNPILGAVVGVATSNENGGKKGVAIAIQELKKIWPSMPPSLLTQQISQDLLVQLYTLLQQFQLPKHTLQDAYTKCVPEDLTALNIWSFPKADNDAHLLSLLFKKLEEVPETKNGVAAILAFAEYLVHITEQFATKDYAKRLRHWINTYIDVYKIEREKVAHFQSESEAHRIYEPQTPRKAPVDTAQNPHSESPHSHPSHFSKQGTSSTQSFSPSASCLLSLLVKLRRKQGSKLFFVQAWLRDNENAQLLPFPLVLKNDASLFDKAYSLGHMPVLLAQFLTDIAEYAELERKQAQKVSIELFVPCELFDKDFDSWNIDNQLPLGMRYQLFIRAAEREKINDKFWMEKCQILHQHTHAQHSNLVHWIDNVQDYCYTNMRNKIAAYLSEPDIVGLAMTICPSHFATPSAKQKLFSTLVLSGIPIAFWPRHLPSDPAKTLEAQKTLSSLLHKQKLSILPEVVQEQRRNAQKGDSHHVGHHLTLFWDEWNTRLPPSEKRFQVISIRS